MREGSVDREVPRHQTVFEDAAAAFGKMALASEEVERAVERLGSDRIGSRHVLREVVAKTAAGDKDRLETAPARDRGERLGHRPDIRVDRKIGPVAGEAAARGERLETSGPEQLVALGGAGGAIEVDEDRIEL